MKENRTKLLRRILSVFLSCVMVFTTLNVQAWAESTTRASAGILNVDTSVGWSLGGTSYGTEGLMTINGNVVYCLERLKTYYAGVTYTPTSSFSSLGYSAATLEKLSLLAYYGNQRAKKENNVDWHAVIGSAIWAETGQGKGWILSPTFNTDAKVKNAIQTLQNDVANYYVKPSFTGETGKVKVGETIHLTDTNNVLSTYTIKSAGGLNAKIEGNQLVITGTANADANATVTFVKNIASADTGTSFLYDAGGDMQKLATFRVSNPISGNVTVTVEKTGNLQIIKKDNKGNTVAGTVFKVSYNADMSSPVGTYTTGSNGAVTISDLKAGKVYIQETSVPAHLVLDSSVKTVTIEASKTATYTAVNSWKQGYVQVVKKDADTGNIIKKAGVTFDIYNSSDTKVQTITTGADGIATSKLLDYGTYYIKETKAPEGYLLEVKVSDDIGVTVNNKTYQITVLNKRVTGTIQITKLDSSTNKSVAGAVYGLYAGNNITDPADGSVKYKKDALVSTFAKTDKNGNASLSGLYLGDYYVKEITAPTKYILNSEKYSVSLTYAGQTQAVVSSSVNVKDQMQKGSITITKADKDLVVSRNRTILDANNDGAQGDATLQGAVYGLYAKEDIVHPDGKTGTLYAKDVLVATFPATDANGKASLDNLYLGKYYVKEITPSEGYLLDPTSYDVELAYAGQNAKVSNAAVTVYETVKKQGFDIFKVGQAEGSTVLKPLQGAEFTVKLVSDVKRLGWDNAPTYDVITTGKDGLGHSIELPYGTYQVRETKVPKNYLPAEDFFVTVTEDSRTPQSFSTNIIVNKEFSAYIRIEKKDADTHTTVAVAGAEFKIKALTDVTVDGREFKAGEYISAEDWNSLNGLEKNIWKTNQNGYIYIDMNFGAGEYQIEEIRAPENYVLDIEPVKFKVSTSSVYEIGPDGKTPVITVVKDDEAVKGQITVEKRGEVLTAFQSASGGNNGFFIYREEGLAGAVFDIIARENITDPADGTVIWNKGESVEKIITGEDGKAISSKLPLGKYIVKEVTAPDGFVLNADAKDVELTYKNQHTAVVLTDASFTNERQKVEIKIKKLDADSSKELAGAQFTLYTERDICAVDGTVLFRAGDAIRTVTTGEDGKANFGDDLPLAIYRIAETKQPDGYVLTHKEFRYDAGYSGQYTKVNSYNATFKNELTIVEVSKQSAATGAELPGASLEIIDPVTGETVENWISSDKPHVVKGLIYGKEYILRETLAPDGYAVATEIRFTVGNEEKVIMKDELSTQFSKQDVNGKEVEGATITVIEKESGNIIDEWISGNESHIITGLIPGMTYIMSETVTADGYIKATDIEFTAGTDNSHIIMTDKRMQIIKTDLVNGEPVVGAELTVTDKETGEVVDSWITDGNPHYVNGLEEGKVYILTEKSAPAGYEVAESIQFTIWADRTDQIVEMKDKPVLTDIQVNKVDSVTKQAVVSKDFIFGLYADKDCKELIAKVHANTEDGTATFEDLRYGTYYIRELEAPKGYKLSKEVKEIIISDELEGVGGIHSFVYENILLPSFIVQAGDAASVIGFAGSGISALGGILYLLRKRKSDCIDEWDEEDDF